MSNAQTPTIEDFQLTRAVWEPSTKVLFDESLVPFLGRNCRWNTFYILNASNEIAHSYAVSVNKPAYIVISDAVLDKPTAPRQILAMPQMPSHLLVIANLIAADTSLQELRYLSIHRIADEKAKAAMCVEIMRRNVCPFIKSLSVKLGSSIWSEFVVENAFYARFGHDLVRELRSQTGRPGLELRSITMGSREEPGSADRSMGLKSLKQMDIPFLDGVVMHMILQIGDE